MIKKDIIELAIECIRYNKINYEDKTGNYYDIPGYLKIKRDTIDKMNNAIQELIVYKNKHYG